MKCAKGCDDKKCWNYDGCEWVEGRGKKEAALWERYRADAAKGKKDKENVQVR
jgi:hypothetical protein